MRRIAPLLAAALLATACRAPGSGGPAPVPDARRTELAGRPSPLPPPTPAGSPDAAATTPAPEAGTPSPKASKAAPSSPASGAGGSGGAPPHPSGSIADPTGDQGVEGPAYADLVAVAVEDIGASVRISVDVAGPLPSPTATGEVLGVGVDLYRNEGEESHYQLFADGSSEGWFAYLTTPQGLVQYPGRFALGGGRLIFEVPWSSLGDAPLRRFSAFLDWSEERPVINAAAGDRAPHEGSVPLSG